MGLSKKSFIKSILTLGCCIFIPLSVGCLGSAADLFSPASGVNGGVSEYSNRVSVGEPIVIKWWFIPPEDMKMTHTGIHYGNSSKPGDLDRSVDITGAGYTEVILPPTILETTNFEVTLTARQSGTIYFRAHAIIDGKNYWSEEKSIRVD
jgi:hypothetical protein